MKNVLVDLGNSVFACGQVYVAMSQVTSLSGLNLINFDPQCIKALDSAITEYSYLRKTFRPTLPSLSSHNHKPKSVQDRLWCTPKLTTLAQQHCADTATTILPRHGFVDLDGCSSYANSIMQCLFHSKVVRNVFRDDSLGFLVELVKCYENNTCNALDCTDIRNNLGDVFSQPVPRDPIDYLQALSNYCPTLSSLLSHSVTIDTQCTLCNTTKTDNTKQLYIHIKIPQDCKTIKMIDLIASTQQYQLRDSTLCDSCGKPTKVHTHIVGAKLLIVVKMDVWSAKSNSKSVRRNTTITVVPNSFIKVNDKTFTLCSSVHVLFNKGVQVSFTLELFSQTINGSTAKTKCCQWKVGLKEQKVYTWHFTSTPIANPRYQKLQVVNLNIKLHS